MAEIRCPMCGKPNPADAVICRHCQARLKPLQDGTPQSPQSPLENTALNRVVPAAPVSPSAQPPAAAPSQPAAPTASSDWLRQLRSETTSSRVWADSSDEESDAETAAQPIEVPDWLSRIRQHAQDDQTQAIESQPAPETQSPPDSEMSPEEKVSDWLKSLRSESEGPADVQETKPSAAPAPPAPPQKAADRPQVIVTRTFDRADTPQTVLPFQLNETPASGHAIGDMNSLRAWLDSLERQENAREDGESAPPPAAPVMPGESAVPSKPQTPVDLPDWLKTSAVQPEESKPAPASAPPENEIPDWLKSIAPQTKPELVQSEETPETPDWMKAFTIEPGEAVLPPGPAVTEEKVPGWMSAFSIDQPEKPVDSSGLPFTAPPESAEPAKTADEKDWLSDLSTAAEEQKETTGGAFVGESGASIAIPEMPGKIELEALPDWIGETSAEEAAEEQEAQGADAALEGLEPAQLPSWLQALRPVEAILPGIVNKEDDQRVERSGPLAGLRGVLPGEIKKAPLQKPAMYAVRLNVTEKQRLHATLLETMLGEEIKAKSLGQEGASLPQTALRLIIAVALIIVLLLPLVLGGTGGVVPLPTASATDFKALLVNLPEGAPVLVAFDYTPGLSGEMRLAATNTIKLLIARKAHIAIISTNPNGPILGQDVLNKAAAGQTTYKLADSTVNLGYLAGGATSLQELVYHTQQAAPFMLDSGGGLAAAWGSPVLKGVNDLTGFSRVIVLTDNVDVGRAWVEQVQPSLGVVPLLVAASAQAAPVLQPYQASGQITAMLSGLSGGMALELAQNSQAQPAYLRSYQAGLFLAAALLILGMIVQGLLVPVNRRKKNNEA